MTSALRPQMPDNYNNATCESKPYNTVSDPKGIQADQMTISEKYAKNLDAFSGILKNMSDVVASLAMAMGASGILEEMHNAEKQFSEYYNKEMEKGFTGLSALNVRHKVLLEKFDQTSSFAARLKMLLSDSTTSLTDKIIDEVHKEKPNVHGYQNTYHE